MRSIQLFFAFFTLFLLASDAKSSQERAPMTFAVSPYATVAEFLQSTKADDSGFHLPASPEFSNRHFWQTTPSKMLTYPAFFKLDSGIIPTAAMIRFIKKSPELFEDKTVRKFYEQALAECISANKQWLSTPTEKAYEKLKKAEATVYAFLGRLDLANPLTRHKVANLLTTPKKGFVQRLIASTALPGRSEFEDKKGELMVKPRNIIIPALKGTLGPIIPLFIFALCIDDLKIPGILYLCALYNNFHAWKNDSNLTPEPHNGIKVSIILDDGPCNDSSASSFGTQLDF